MRYLLLCLCLFLLLVPSRAHAHATSNSYLELTRTEDSVTGRWRVALRDLDGAVGLEQDGDGRIGDAELSERRAVVESYLLSRLELKNDQELCRLTPTALVADGNYLVLELGSAACSGALSLRYDLFFEHDRSHQGHLHVAGTSELDHIFTHEQRLVSLAPGATGARAAWVQYLGQGIWHILIGADHILFLLTLLIGAVLRVERGRHVPVVGFRPAFLSMAKIVTAFTAAHSLTLSLMALGLVSLPSRWVETAIALSIVAAAANNLWPVVTRRTWLLALAFGLIHGLGFANVLLELGLPRGQLLVALLGFNLGVEVGQLGIVALCFPIAFWLRRRAGYQRIGFVWGSALVGFVGLVWSLERALDARWTARLLGASDERTASAAVPERRVRPCEGVPALAEPALYDAVLATVDEDAATVAERRAFELACAGELEPSARVYAEALAAGDARTPAPTRAWLLTGYAEVERARGQHDHATKLLRQAEAIWRTEGADQALADTLARQAELMAREEQWADVYRLYNEARGLHTKTGDTRSLANDLARLGDVLVSAADPHAAKSMYEKAQAAYEQVGDLSGAAAQYRNLAIVARLNADAPGAAQMYRRALDLHRRQGHQPEVAADLAALARTHLGMAEYAEAKGLYEEANAIERQLGRKRFLARNYNQLGNLHQIQGELAPAEQMYREALSFSEQLGDTTEAANNWANLASVEHKQGRVARARTMYERSLSLFEQSGARSKALRVRGLLASLGTQNE
jgi:tetratricopeptide (TPR) repeat protein